MMRTPALGGKWRSRASFTALGTPPRSTAPSSSGMQPAKPPPMSSTVIWKPCSAPALKTPAAAKIACMSTWMVRRVVSASQLNIYWLYHDGDRRDFRGGIAYVVSPVNVQEFVWKRARERDRGNLTPRHSFLYFLMHSVKDCSSTQVQRAIRVPQGDPSYAE